MKYLDPLRNWYLGLDARERKIVTAGGIALCLILVWLVIISPWLSLRASQRSNIRSDTQLLAWMQRTTTRIKHLESIKPDSKQQSHQSLFSIVEQTARQSPIGDHIANFQPEGNDEVQVQLKRAPFDALIKWIGTLQTRHDIKVTDLGVQRTDATGTVNATLTVKRVTL